MWIELLVLIHITLYTMGMIDIMQMIAIMFGILKPIKKHMISTILSSEPIVTVQLPIFNEGQLIEELVESITKIEHPKSKLQILLLDDSTDGTIDISKKLVNKYKKLGWDIELIHRENRQGFKSGALSNALKFTKGEFILVFDADFRPPTDFLQKTLPYFTDERVAFVKSNIKLSNNTNIFTSMYDSMVVLSTQIDQVGRDRLGLFQQTSGSSFILRKSALMDVGGWSTETLTEDCDISYALYLKSWKNVYVSDVYSNCLAPKNLKSLWIQQFRWAKGTTQCYLKHRQKIKNNNSLTISEKIVALFSGSHYIVFLLFISSFIMGFLLSLIFFIYPNLVPLSFNVFVLASTIITIIILAIMLFLFHKKGYNAIQGLGHILFTSAFFYCIAFPVIKGVFSAFRKKPSEFITTPK